jgi:hypothetical protein
MSLNSDDEWFIGKSIFGGIFARAGRLPVLFDDAGDHPLRLFTALKFFQFFTFETADIGTFDRLFLRVNHGVSFSFKYDVSYLK